MELTEFTYIGVALLLLMGLICVLTFYTSRSQWKTDVKHKIVEITRSAKSHEPLILTAVLIHADKLLDHALKMYGVTGKTMGERLKNSKKLFDPKLYNQIWEAHKLRNTIAHEQNTEAPVTQLRDHIHSLTKASRLIAS